MFQYRQPLKTTENTEPLTRAGSGKRRKVTKQLNPANTTKTTEERKKTIVGRGTNGGAATDMSSDFSASLKMTRLEDILLKLISAAKCKACLQPEKTRGF